MKKLLLTIFSLFAVCPLLSSQDFYLRGINNEWGTASNFKFTSSNGIYTLHVDELTSGYSFKIATESWDRQYGSTAGFAFDTPMPCVAGDGNNIRIPAPGNSGDTKTIVHGATLTFDYRNTSQPTLSIIPDLYLAGELTSWSNSDSRYRFSENNGVYTLNVAELDGKFRIAAGVTPDWPDNLNFGGSAGMSVGQSYVCTAGSGNDMSMNEKVTNAVITFDKNDMRMTVGTAATEIGEKGLYLAGTVNNWNSNNPAYRFNKEGDEYTLSLDRLTGEFKIVTSDWAYQFGCTSTIEYGKAYSCVLADNGSNMRLYETTGSGVIIKFNLASQTVEINGMPTLYLIGDMNGWTRSPLYEFRYDDGKYILSTDDFSGNFKIVSLDRSLVFGSTSENPFDINRNYALDGVAENDDNHISFNGLPSRASSRVTMTLTPDGTPDRPTTSVSVVATDDVPVEYFNLQGIKVAHPANGIYIRRRGSETEKIIVH